MHDVLGLADASRGGKEARRWEAALSKAFPTLLGGYMCAGELAANLMEDELLPDELNGAQWRNHMGYPSRNQAVSGRFYTHSSSPKQDEDEPNTALIQMQADLVRMGCKAVRFSNSYVTAEGKAQSSEGLFLPHMKLGKTASGDYYNERDIDGAALMLAYLLDKGLVKEEEIPKKDTDEHGHPIPGIAFGPLILKMAKSDTIQRKLHRDTAAGTLSPEQQHKKRLGDAVDAALAHVSKSSEGARPPMVDLLLEMKSALRSHELGHEQLEQLQSANARLNMLVVTSLQEPKEQFARSYIGEDKLMDEMGNWRELFTGSLREVGDAAFNYIQAAHARLGPKSPGHTPA